MNEIITIFETAIDEIRKQGRIEEASKISNLLTNIQTIYTQNSDPKKTAKIKRINDDLRILLSLNIGYLYGELSIRNGKMNCDYISQITLNIYKILTRLLERR